MGMVNSPTSPEVVMIGQMASVFTSNTELFWSKYQASFT